MKPATKATIVTTAVVILLAAIVATIALVNRPEPRTAPATDGTLPGTRANSHVLDNAGPNAPTLVEFLDFECEACGAFYPVVEQLREDYAGEINFVVRYFPLPGHYNSMNAAIAAEAAAQQGELEAMHSRLFETQAEWGELRESRAALFRSYAEDIGLDMDAYDAAVADPATKERVEQDFDDGQYLNVTGTPTFFLDGKKLELQQLSDLTGALDRATGRSPQQ
ncbi:DsbA family protein [Microbacterium sp.]|uniref:DsbA family protein n=1 Tax=Microbacterium sp. TaxID=51671 RepID=UPI003734E040